ncbi:unnamed protein product [Hydatigera taeniaeformis]|uniref:Peptidase C14 n=1 Tax=Hydatigena taeniaeformis TaxID=6205 RepID=A0A0R3XB33_HYDTA|nr:unnamed protein product [Hydatigera taeniaeformis]
MNILPICAILSLFCTLFFIFFIDSTIKPRIINYADRLLIASQVRDRDELRLAEANTLIGQWRLKKWLPLSLTNRFYYGGSNNFLILMITSNRGHRKIDVFEPYYLTQTSVTLVKTLLSAKARAFEAIGKVDLLLCSVGSVNDTDGVAFNSELKRLRRVFGPNSFVQPSKIFDGLCKSVLDTISCISLGLKRYSASNYVVLLEDDFLVTETFLPSLNIYANRTEANLLRLYSGSENVVHDPTLGLYMFLLYLVAMFPLLVAFCFIYSRFSKRGIWCLAAAMLIVIVLLVRKDHSKPNSLTLSPSSDLKRVATGAAVVLPKNLAEKLGRTDSRTVCASSNSVQSKTDLVARGAMELKLSILDVHPPAVIHIGMYSQNRDYIYDPLLFPH